MSKKPMAAEKPLPQRIAKARQEGRSQQALELARQLVKQEPTDAHRELLRQVTLERGMQLQTQGLMSDAASVYQNALTMGGPADFVATIAHRLAKCGAIGPALAAMERIADPTARQRILDAAVDAAVMQGPASKALLPADLHPGFDLIGQGFAHYEAGRDEEARAALQGIGLQSPFLAWKLLLRGLLAYSVHDDVRAVENWQRLVQGRVPFALSAMMRVGVEPAFLASQPPGTQKVLRAKWAQLHGVTVAPHLRDLKAMLLDNDLRPTFRRAEQIIVVLRHEHPNLMPRLGHCFAWGIIDHGQPEDLDRFRRLFGCPPDDPNLHRLEALALEARGMWPEAHKAWQDFIADVAANPAVWPGDSSKRAQALVWMRMADNAQFKRNNRRPSGNPFFDMFAAHPAPLKPTPEQCLEHAIKLAPDRLDGYIALFDLHRDARKYAKAKKIGQQLLKRFPDHADTMEALGALCMDMGDFNKAQEYFEKAIQANPLDRTLRLDLARAKQSYGLKLTLDGKIDLARAQYEQAVQLWDGSKTSLLCQWAVAELKAKDPARAEALIAQASAEADHRLACRYALVGESVRAKLPPKEKKRLADDFKSALAQAPTPAEILVLIESAAHQRIAHEAAFHGQKTQEKTILKFLDDIHFDAFNEHQLMRLCTGLSALDARKPWFNCLNYARRHYLKSPFFRLSYADYYLMEDALDPKTHLAREHLDDARRLIGEMPRGEEQQQLLEQVKAREEVIAEIHARGPTFTDVMDQFFAGGGPFTGPDDDDFDEDEDSW